MKTECQKGMSKSKKKQLEKGKTQQNCIVAHWSHIV
jgi:hypothetical protein